MNNTREIGYRFYRQQPFYVNMDIIISVREIFAFSRLSKTVCLQFKMKDISGLINPYSVGAADRAFENEMPSTSKFFVESYQVHTF